MANVVRTESGWLVGTHGAVRVSSIAGLGLIEMMSIEAVNRESWRGDGDGDEDESFMLLIATVYGGGEVELCRHATQETLRDAIELAGSRTVAREIL